MAKQESKSVKWYQSAAVSVCEMFSVDPSKGLSQKEASHRQEKYGRNELPQKGGIGALGLLIGQFKDALIIVLLAAATVSLVLAILEHEAPTEAFLIYAIVVAIAVIGFLNEYKAERTVAALRKLLSFTAQVVRGGEVAEVDVAELVPGDILLLNEGQKIPADARIIEANELRLNEASLTGESATQLKNTAILGAKDLALGDQTNMVFSGTLVATGTGRAVVVATGAQTQIGQIAQMVNAVEDQQTPMQRKLDALGRRLGVVVIGLCAVAFIAIFFFDTHDAEGLDFVHRLLFAFTAAVALAVAAIPEGLAFVVRISLALGARRMAKRKALVRRLSAVESLGSTDIVCTDKTGTLTKGEMTVRRLFVSGETYHITGSGYAPEGELLLDGEKTKPNKQVAAALAIGVLCNNARLKDGGIVGDPTEACLLVAAKKLAVTPEETERVQEFPFTSDRKMMATVHAQKGGFLVAAKGAPEVILERSTHIMRGGKIQPMTAAAKREIQAAVKEMAGSAMRVLALAQRDFAKKPTQKEAEWHFVFTGLVGILDPPRVEVKEVIQRVQSEAGMRVIMITGDNIATAQAVAREVGIVGEAITGVQLDSLNQKEFEADVEKFSIYARVNPEHKIRIVQALKKHGHQVAMTGDGVNDAPALKAADIGVAMGITGTDAAKEASDLILLDDKFVTIIHAIEEGRGIYDNVRKFVNFLLSCNIAEVLVVFMGILLHGQLLLTATQILFLNIVTDGLPAIALGADPIAKDVMHHSPKRFQQNIVSGRIWAEIIIFGVLMSVVVLLHFNQVIGKGTLFASSIVFASLVVYEFARLFDIRTDYKMGIFSNRLLWGSVLLSFVITFSLLFVPLFADLFELTAPAAIDWVIMASAAIGLIICMKLLNPVLDRVGLRGE